MRAQAEASRTIQSQDGRFTFRFPSDPDGLDQDQEWFELQRDEDGADADWERLRIHDYDKLFATPGLYEALVYDTLKCRSPRRLVALLREVLDNWPTSPGDLRVLDLGAGNGIVGERLREANAKTVVGIDILPEAKAAAVRDYPDAYDEYLIADLTELTEGQQRTLREANFNALTTVAALGFGDIPPRAFANAFNYVSTPGWIAFTIKEDFLSDGDESGFSGLMKTMLRERIINLEGQLRMFHRESLAGEKLFYLGVVARKLRDIPEDAIRRAE
ncbi:MAG: class I SAM-dependent DNA methyltransferase [Phycisphaerales bacterium]